MNQNKKLLVTGGSGFIGHALLHKLSRYSDFGLFTLIRSYNSSLPGEVVQIQGNFLGVLDEVVDFSNIDVVIHAAALTSTISGSTKSLLAEFRKVNVEGTLNLARQAADAGVKRFIFISSIKVNGEFTHPGKPFTASGKHSPQDSYGVSKCEAETGLYSLAAKTGMDIVIIRPPLVYGAGVKGNFASLIRMLNKGIPLPLGSIGNKRSLVALDNLLDFILTCVNHPAAANEIFLVSDGEDLSTTELLQRLGKALNKPARLIPFPVSLLTLLATVLGKKSMANRLCCSLQVDISKAREILDWVPPITTDEGIKRAVEGYTE